MIFNHHVDDALPNKVFNHDLTDAADSNSYLQNSAEEESGGKTIAEKLGLMNYPGRVLGSTYPTDILQLHPNLKKHWDWVREHYARCGISHSDQIIWDDNPAVMASYMQYEPSVFLFGERSHTARPDQRWFDIVQEMNSKNSFIQLCDKLGIQTPKTWIFECKREIIDLKMFPFPVYLKIAVSVSGLGVVCCNDVDELELQLERIDEGIPLQIQQSVDAFSFLNLQYRKNGKLERVAATEQVLKGCCHAGNAFPTKHQPWNITDQVADYMVQQGMKGYFAFDIAVCKDGNSYKYYLIECNPRYNGSSYPTNIARKLGASEWIAKKVDTSVTSFSGIDLGDVEYDRHTKQGAVIVNWGCIEQQELGVLLVAPTYAQQMDIGDRLSVIVN